MCCDSSRAIPTLICLQRALFAFVTTPPAEQQCCNCIPAVQALVGSAGVPTVGNTLTQFVKVRQLSMLWVALCWGGNCSRCEPA
jgi:hypothetical protein